MKKNIIIVWAEFRASGYNQFIDEEIPIPDEWYGFSGIDYEKFAKNADNFTTQWIGSQIDTDSVQDLSYGWYSEESDSFKESARRSEAGVSN